MTRDYNKQRRDDMRPSSRNQSTNRYRNEQPPRPARPRLNRETVDRAWEAGAATQHPDYRPRRSNASNGQPPRDNWRYNQSSEHSSAQNGRKPYRNQVDRNRRFERNGDNNPGFRSHPYNSGRGGFDDQRTNRPGYRDNSFSQTNERRSPYRGNDQKRDNQRRYPENSERQPRDVGRSTRAPQGYEGSAREFGRDNRVPRKFEPNGRPGAGYRPPVRDAQNPRWQSRPTAQRGPYSSRRSQDNGFASQAAQFEGDYERFNAPDFAHQRGPEQASRMSPERDRPQAETRHVTRMPDGRVLKGPRPAQRRNAQFWSGVAQETENLLQPAATTADDSEPELVPQFEGPTAEPQDTATAHLAQDSPVEVEQDKPAATRKTRARSSSSGNSRTGPATRKKKTDAAIKPRSTGPRPSQRGYKWPAS